MNLEISHIIKLFDNLLKSKFQQLLEQFKYIEQKIISTVGFQMLEIINEDKCKMIGDPNGYCCMVCILCEI